MVELLCEIVEWQWEFGTKLHTSRENTHPDATKNKDLLDIPDVILIPKQKGCRMSWSSYKFGNPTTETHRWLFQLDPSKIFAVARCVCACTKTKKIKYENLHLGVSKNRGTPKWMVYNGKPY